MRHYFNAALAALFMAAVLGGCGGSVGSGGTGSPVGYAEGSVTGFGSVIVDGVRFNDSQAAVTAERGPGDTAAAELQLGHQVELTLSDDSAAQAIRIEAQVVGPVSAVSSQGVLTVLGQTVSANADADTGPVTLFAGYAGIGNVSVGDVVEVHAVLRTTSASGHYFQATRIEKRTDTPAYWRVAGQVTGLSSSSGSRGFQLGGLEIDHTDANVVPTSQMLANGQMVVVFGKTLETGSGGQPVLVAEQVRIKPHEAAAGQQASVGGVVDALDATAQHFSLNGVTVRYANATITPGNRTLTEGSYVQASGSFASDGTFNATHVKIRKKQDDDEVQLSGTLTDYDSTGQRFQLRGVSVSAAGAVLNGCSGGLRDGLFVEVTGSIVSNDVVAERIACGQEPPGGVVEREGVAGAVDGAARRFTLTPDQGAALTVQWSDATYFGNGLTPQTLAGQELEVEGSMNGGVLMAKRIHRDD